LAFGILDFGMISGGHAISPMLLKIPKKNPSGKGHQVWAIFTPKPADW
jgi:hypothetical protein